MPLALFAMLDFLQISSKPDCLLFVCAYWEWNTTKRQGGDMHDMEVTPNGALVSESPIQCP